MTRTITKRARIVEDVPAHLVEVKLPPGVTLEKYIETVNARLKGLYPKPKVDSVELGPECAEMIRIAKYNRDLWEMRYQLLKLEIREQLGFAKKGTADGIPFIDRRQFPVSGYKVDPYDQDAIYPL